MACVCIILTLPLKIFEHIAELAQPEDLTALRLTCKEAAANSQRPFAKAFFTKRAFLLSDEESLRTLLTIAEHETFGRTMETVVICVDEVPSDDHTAMRLAAFGPQDDERESITKARLRTKQQWEDRRVILDQRKLMQGQKIDVWLLFEALTQFKKHGNVIKLQVMDQGEAGIAARNAKTLEYLSGGRLWWMESNERLVDTVLRALVPSKLLVEHFTVSMDNCSWSIQHLTNDVSIYSDAIQAFGSLKYLRLRFDVEQDAGPEDAAKFVRLIESAQCLERLSLQALRPSFFTNPTILKLLGTLFMTSELAALRFLDLQGIPADFSHVVTFLKRHRKVEHLHFHGNHSNTLWECDHYIKFRETGNDSDSEDEDVAEEAESEDDGGGDGTMSRNEKIVED